ncbi:hypothetical protein [Paenibacillus endoradicis]|nr:hypothetical protein [Paenibacillus endoradicis]MCR8656600.1 hypothetical protein [Paenibacillus endoradicis]
MYGKPVKILIVDRDKRIRKLLKSALEKEGYLVEESQDPINLFLD